MQNRHSFRYRGYDYRQNGAYFVTVCVYNRRCVFGQIRDYEMRLNDYGRIVTEEWEISAEKRANLVLDAFVVMPNHLHFIVFISRDDNQTFDEATGTGEVLPQSLAAFVRAFKGAVSKRINERRGQPTQVWQRLYWERIIRDERELDLTRRYIENNPVNWANDELNPKNIKITSTPNP